MKIKEIDCKGKIIQIDHHELFCSRRHNYYNSVIYGLPFQLSHQNIEYTIRVELNELKLGSRFMDFCLYGDYMGLLHVGDTVSLVAYEHKGRKIVKAIYNDTTASRANPQLQIPAWVVRAKLIVPIALLILLMSMYVGFCLDSVFWGVITALFSIPVSIISFFILFIKDSVE